MAATNVPQQVGNFEVRPYSSPLGDLSRAVGETALPKAQMEAQAKMFEAQMMEDMSKALASDVRQLAMEHRAKKIRAEDREWFIGDREHAEGRQDEMIAAGNEQKMRELELRYFGYTQDEVVDMEALERGDLKKGLNKRAYTRMRAANALSGYKNNLAAEKEAYKRTVTEHKRIISDGQDALNNPEWRRLNPGRIEALNDKLGQFSGIVYNNAETMRQADGEGAPEAATLVKEINELIYSGQKVPDAATKAQQQSFTPANQQQKQDPSLQGVVGWGPAKYRNAKPGDKEAYYNAAQMLGLDPKNPEFRHLARPMAGSEIDDIRTEMKKEALELRKVQADEEKARQAQEQQDLENDLKRAEVAAEGKRTPQQIAAALNKSREAYVRDKAKMYKDINETLEGFDFGSARREGWEHALREDAMATLHGATKLEQEATYQDLKSEVDAHGGDTRFMTDLDEAIYFELQNRFGGQR